MHAVTSNMLEAEKSWCWAALETMVAIYCLKAWMISEGTAFLKWSMCDAELSIVHEELSGNVLYDVGVDNCGWEEGDVED